MKIRNLQQNWHKHKVEKKHSDETSTNKNKQLKQHKKTETKVKIIYIYKIQIKNSLKFNNFNLLFCYENCLNFLQEKSDQLEIELKTPREIDDKGTKTTRVILTNDILQKMLKLGQGIKHF